MFDDRRKVAGLALSAAALVGIAGWESYRGEAYYATADEKQRGISTIGWGNTEGVKPGDKITPDRALVRLLATTEQFQQRLRDCIGPEVRMTQGQWDAVTSWAYNVGTGSACTSTLVRKAQAGQEFCSELLRWNRQGGQVLPGLTRRREAEYRTCTGG